MVTYVASFVPCTLCDGAGSFTPPRSEEAIHCYACWGRKAGMIERRPPRRGEWYLGDQGDDHHNLPMQAYLDFKQSRDILKRVVVADEPSSGA